MKDALLKQTLTLPNGAATTTSSAIDLGAGPKEATDIELVFNAATLSLTLLPNTQTITFSLEFSDTEAFSTVRKTVSLGVQTGATGTDPCAAISNVRHRCASNEHRYARIKAVKTGAADSSTGTAATLEVDN